MMEAEKIQTERYLQRLREHVPISTLARDELRFRSESDLRSHRLASIPIAVLGYLLLTAGFPLAAHLVPAQWNSWVGVPGFLLWVVSGLGLALIGLAYYLRSSAEMRHDHESNW